MTRPTPSPPAVEQAGAGPDGGSARLRDAERQRAQHLLLVFARLGAILTEALHARVDRRFSSNVEVLVLTSLDLFGPQRPADMIALTDMTSGGITKVIDRLEEQQLVTRRAGSVEGDRRGTHLALTPEGALVAAELAKALVSRMDVVREAVEELGSLACD